MIDPTKLLAGIPTELRDPLLQCYREIVANFLEHRWEPSELNGGKFCEVVHTILDGALSGSFPTKPSKPRNMVDACRALEQVTADATRIGDKSLRIFIPRMLPILYDIRNNRGVGHVGGDVDPNFLDATAVHTMASWVLSELVRIFHNASVGAGTKPALIVKSKSRNIFYASHVDGYIYGYYNYVLQQAYEKFLLEHDLTNNVIAYRSVTKNGVKYCNCHFAEEAFQFVRSTPGCHIHCFDISKFFDKLSVDVL